MGFTLLSILFFMVFTLSNGERRDSLTEENILALPDDGGDDNTNIAFRYIKYLSKNEDEQVAKDSDEDDEESHLHHLDSGSEFDKEEIIEIEINNNKNDELILLEDKPVKTMKKEDSVETEIEITSESEEEEIEITHEWNGVGKDLRSNKNRAVDSKNEEQKSHKKKKSK